jgi:hypothetical protein
MNTERDPSMRAQLVAFCAEPRTRRELIAQFGKKALHTMRNAYIAGQLKNVGDGKGGIGRYQAAEHAPPVVVREPRIRPGQRVGLLTIVRKVHQKGRTAVYLCACKCGGERIARANTLSDGTPTSCGCQGQRMRPEMLALAEELGLTLKPGKPRETQKAKAERVRVEKAAQRATARPRKTIVEPWTPRKAQKPLGEPAQRAEGATVAPVRALGRYGVDPASVPRLFSALKPGQYLDEVAA